MDDDLLEEINYEIDFLVDTGFYDIEDILETIIDEFIDFDLDEDRIYGIIEEKFENHQKQSNSSDVNNLKDAFNRLSKEGIVSIHNCGYDVKEGVEDSFEVYTHLINNKYNPRAFCFYTLSDIEEVFEDKILNISFGLYKPSDKKASRELASEIIDILQDYDFNIKWGNNPEKPIKITDFVWKKTFDNDNYFMEGAYGDFVKNNSKD